MGTIANTVFLTAVSNTAYTIPSNFASFISVEAIGAGGNGGAGSNNGGGGGGSYSKSTSITGLSVGTVCHYKAGVAGGTGGSANTTGRSWFSTTLGEPNAITNGVLAEPGSNAISTTGAAGGVTTTSIGDVKFAGGNGGGNGGGPGGGGGAAGPGGVGGAGGNGDIGSNAGGGGGGAASATHAGYPGGTAASTVPGTGGNGGDNTSGVGTGSGGPGGATAAKGYGGYQYNLWVQTSDGTTAGPGGGGGGGFALLTAMAGYGGGGPGGGASSIAGTKGIVVFTYNAYIAPNITSIQPSTGDYHGGTTVTILGQGFINATSITFDGTAIANTIVSDTSITFISPSKPNGTVSTIIVTNPIGTDSITYNNGVVNFNQYQPYTGFNTTDPNTGNLQDLGSRYTTKSYLLDVYPNIASQLGARTAPGLWVSGLGTGGILGLGDTISRSSPVQVGSLTNWMQISYGIGVKQDGTLWSWGYNQNGQLGLADIIGRSSPVQVPGLTNWKQVSSNGSAAAAINNLGRLYTWGSSFGGALGQGSALVNLSSPVQVGALTNWKQVVCGNSITASIKTDGTLWMWGVGAHGELGQGNITYYSSPVQVGSLTNWKQVSVGSGVTVSVKTDGTLWTWGTNAHGELGLGDIISRSSPTQVGLLTNWKSVSALYLGWHAIKTDGTLWACGYNAALTGNLGLGDVINRSSPTQVGSLTNWKQVYSGGPAYTQAAIKTDGTLWTWGGNLGGGTYGQLGLGDIISRSSPVQVGLLTNWKQAFIGFSLVAIQDGYI